MEAARGSARCHYVGTVAELRGSPVINKQLRQLDEPTEVIAALMQYNA
jgi:hypothetical protein